MWQSSSILAESPSLISEVRLEHQASGSNHPSSSEDTLNEVLISSRRALICYEVPDNTSSLVSQSLPNSTLLEMNSNNPLSPMRRQRRTYGQRFHPYGVSSQPDSLAEANTEKVLTLHPQNTVISSLESRRGLSLSHGHCQCVERFFDIKQGSGSASLESRDLSENLLQIPDRYINTSAQLNRLFGYLSFNTEIQPPTTKTRNMANYLIKLSRHYKSPNLIDLCCPDCRHMPVLPVTGQCGHTRCMRCTVSNGTCPCGIIATKTLFVNTVVRDIVEKTMKNVKSPRVIAPGSVTRATEPRTNPLLVSADEPSKRQEMQFQPPELKSTRNSTQRPWMPMTIQARHHQALELLSAGRHLEAASHLVRVAASTELCARTARILLAQTINTVCKYRNARSVFRELCQCVREQSAQSWVSPEDVECVLCTNTFTEPVSTPCGHTYCRGCVKRLLYYKKQCALCCGPLDDFKLAETRDTVFISSILSSINLIPKMSLPDEADVIPVVMCNIAFPGAPCPLHIFSPRYCLMVQRALESGSRRFGMVAAEKGSPLATHGTVLEIRDCVLLEDNCCIVSTVGVSRFKVLERSEKEWCDVARIEPFGDEILTEQELETVKSLADKVLKKAISWLESLDENLQKIIGSAFGSMPYDDTSGNWWEKPDGPYWLWWLIAVLPLNNEVKFLILSTPSLLKRLRAVFRTLSVIDTDIFTSNNPRACDPHVNYWFPFNQVESLRYSTNEILDATLL